MGICESLFDHSDDGSRTVFLCELSLGILQKVFDRSDENVNYVVDKALLLLLTGGLAAGAYGYYHRDYYGDKLSQNYEHYRQKFGGMFQNVTATVNQVKTAQKDEENSSHPKNQ